MQSISSYRFRLIIISLLASLPLLTQAQTNYVANTANSSSPSQYNTLVGPDAGYSTTTGFGNSFMGYQAGQNNISGYSNVVLGI